MIELPKTSRAAIFMLIGMATIPMVDVFAKFLGQQGFHVVQLVWARFVFGALAALPFVLPKTGVGAFRPNQPFLQVARAATLIVGTALFFLGLKYLPLADTLALFFVQPVLITALSPFFLREKVGSERWVMVFLGFVGVLIIIRPGFQAFNPGVAFALGAGLSSALYMIITRHMSGTIDAVTTNFQTCLIGAVPLTVAMPWFWLWPNPVQLGMLASIGVVAMLSHVMIARAYSLGEASLISPLAYTEMITAVFFGWLFFGDFPDRYTFLGVGILMACAIFVSSSKGGTRSTKDTEAGRM